MFNDLDEVQSKQERAEKLKALQSERDALKAELGKLKADCDMEIRNEQLAEISKLKAELEDHKLAIFKYREGIEACSKQRDEHKSRAVKYREALEKIIELYNPELKASAYVMKSTAQEALREEA